MNIENCKNVEMGRKRGSALWPPDDEAGEINGLKCRLTDGRGGLVLNVTSATRKTRGDAEAAWQLPPPPLPPSPSSP